MSGSSSTISTVDGGAPTWISAAGVVVKGTAPIWSAPARSCASPAFRARQPCDRTRQDPSGYGADFCVVVACDPDATIWDRAGRITAGTGDWGLGTGD